MRVKFKNVEMDTTSRGVLGSVQFERKYGIPYAEAFAEGNAPRVEWMAFLAYGELKADGQDVGEFDDDFFAGLEFLAPVETDVAEAPSVPLVPEVQPI